MTHSLPLWGLHERFSSDSILSRFLFPTSSKGGFSTCSSRTNTAQNCLGRETQTGQNAAQTLHRLLSHRGPKEINNSAARPGHCAGGGDQENPRDRSMGLEMIIPPGADPTRELLGGGCPCRIVGKSVSLGDTEGCFTQGRDVVRTQQDLAGHCPYVSPSMGCLKLQSSGGGRGRLDRPCLTAGRMDAKCPWAEDRSHSLRLPSPLPPIC